METPQPRTGETPNLLVLLGPTATGKTRLAVAAARELGGEILSADSRQVFRGMDVGTGKDLAEYGEIPYHLIDLLDAGDEFSVHGFLRAFRAAFEDVSSRGRLPLLVGGTGLYLDAVLRGYELVDVPEDPALRAELAALPDAELAERLRALNPSLHNTTDLVDRARLVRAIEIAAHRASGAAAAAPLPDLRPVVFGLALPRDLLRRRITERLRARLDGGMIEEVAALVAAGVPAERLEAYGLEYRFVSRYLRRELTRNDLFQKLNAAIHDFAKRQETWFRRMERHGVEIFWLDGTADPLPALLGEARRRGL
ncbi:MAG: tRNA (adenosine(37)-N6)-dimethylallyltransferase MiaA [Deltaproteobacteria bacterium]|nr:tRNA (adenosine(37)-N6)-dimethylallyltransferase MiaA [Deltaproteobacteria bacterium]